MAIEQGIVTKTIADSSRAWVRTIPNSACASCSSRHGCAEAGMDKEREVEVINEVGARPGDRIQLEISTRSLLKICFLLYIFPVLCMLAAGLTGDALAPMMSIDPSAGAAVAAIIGLLAAMTLVFARGKRMDVKTEYHPRIIRVIGRYAVASTDADHPASCARGAGQS